MAGATRCRPGLPKRGRFSREQTSADGVIPRWDEAERGVTAGVTLNFRWVLLACRRPGSGRAGAAELLRDNGLALGGLAAQVFLFGYDPVYRCRRAVRLHGGLLSELQLLVF